LVLRPVLIFLVYVKRIQDPIPYPITTVSIKSIISVILVVTVPYGKTWRVVNKSNITRTIIIDAVTLNNFLLLTRLIYFNCNILRKPKILELYDV
jgi:hypothetical protein